MEDSSGLKYRFTIRIGPPWLTKYERARVIGARALQIALGAPPLIPLEHLKSKNPIRIAEEELKRKVLPLVIRRWLPNGEYQDIPLRVLVH